MSVTPDHRSRPAAGLDDLAEEHDLAQVERWMAIIREINEEQHFSSDLDVLERRLRETISANGSDAELSIRRG